MTLFDLTGKTAIVTGGGSGIGQAYCTALSEFGANIVCVGRTESKNQETLQKTRSFGNEARSIVADICKPDDIQRIVDQTLDSFGSIDIFIANAGIREISFVPIHEKSIEDWDSVMDTNLRSVFLQMRVVFPVMMKQKTGNFITTTSVGGLWPISQDKWVNTQTAYATAKAGLIMLTKLAARQYGKYGIRVNSICPGYHRTPLTPVHEVTELENKLIKSIPLGRTGMPDDIKGLVVWLASDASSFVTGQVIVEDGGYFA